MKCHAWSVGGEKRMLPEHVPASECSASKHPSANARVTESSNLTRAAAVVAPTLKLCLVSPVVSSPRALSVSRRWNNNFSLDSGHPSWNRNSGPDPWLRRTRYPRIAATGQMACPVFPKWIYTPLPNWSVYEWRKWIDTMVGTWWESPETSAGQSILGVKVWRDGQVNSPACMNPKYAVQHAAQSIDASYCLLGGHPAHD